MSDSHKSRIRELGVRLANIRANPRGGHENQHDSDEADNPIRTARSVLFSVHGRNLPGVIPPVAIWTEEQQVALDILMLTTIDMI